jgi:hypothetical protein
MFVYNFKTFLLYIHQHKLLSTFISSSSQCVNIDSKIIIVPTFILHHQHHIVSTFIPKSSLHCANIHLTSSTSHCSNIHLKSSTSHCSNIHLKSSTSHCVNIHHIIISIHVPIVGGNTFVSLPILIIHTFYIHVGHTFCILHTFVNAICYHFVIASLLWYHYYCLSFHTSYHIR